MDRLNNPLFYPASIPNTSPRSVLAVESIIFLYRGNTNPGSFGVEKGSISRLSDFSSSLKIFLGRMAMRSVKFAGLVYLPYGYLLCIFLIYSI